MLKQKCAEKLPRFILTLLLSLGLCLPFLKGLNLPFALPSCLLLVAGLSLLLEALTWNRRSALWGGSGLVLLFLLWLFSSGLPLLTDLLRAFTLQVSGVPGALPLVGREAALFFQLLFTLMCFLCARRPAGSLPAILLTVGSLLVLWLADRADLLPWLLPAGIATVCLLLLERRQELSLARVLPWVTAVFLLAYGLTPRPGVVLPSLKDRMDAFRQSVMDRLFFTEPREVFSLSLEGFYPQGGSQLGGPVHPTDHPVMQVSTPRTAYLRGVMMNEYDGRAWRNTLGGRRYLWDASGVASERARLFDQHLPDAALSSSLTEEMQVSVRMLTVGASTLFTPQRVRSLRAGGELVPYFTNSSELFVTRNLQEGDTWTVSAPLMMAGDPGIGTLVSAASAREDAAYESVRETYTALPSHLEEPLWLLAAEITDAQTTPYEKAFALQNYLSRNYRYTLTVDPQPASIDFVTNFLFNTREGYCTYFASALTVLCRMVGLPARYVEGYLAQPNAAGEALVTGLNAHAWTEVYFRGFGWLTFDATPRQGSGGGESEPTLAPEDAASFQTPTPPPTAPDTPTPAPGEDSSGDPDADSTPPPEADPPESPANPAESGRLPWLEAVLTLLGLLLLLAGAALLRWRLTSPAIRCRRAKSEAERFDLWMEDALLRLSASGQSRASGETLMNFTRRLDAEGKIPVALGRLGECASLLHYGRVQALPTDTALAREAALALKKALPGKARLRYALRCLGRSKRTPAEI